MGSFGLGDTQLAGSSSEGQRHLDFIGGKEAVRRADLALSTECKEPGNEAERKLAAIWRDVFGIDAVGITDDFFELGGDSFTATALAAEIEATFGTRFTPADIITLSTVAQQAEKLAKEQPAEGQDGDKPAEPAPQDPPADESSAPPADEPAPAGTEAAPEPQAAAQGRDRRQALWDDIIKSGARARMSPEDIRTHFRTWSMDAAPASDNYHPPVEIDGPDATSDLLTRYCHVLRAVADEKEHGQ